MSQLLKYFVPSNHPNVVSGKQTADEILHLVVDYLKPVNSKHDSNCISYAVSK